jgi:hypothetical protein
MDDAVDHDGNVYLFGRVFASVHPSAELRYGLVRFNQIDPTPFEYCDQ